MGTRTAPRRKTKQIQRKKQQAARAQARSPMEKEVESATFAEGDFPISSPETPSEIPTETAPTGSPAEAAQAWAEQNEANSTIKQVAAAALICGQKVSKTASALGVDRRTIQRWQKLDPEFQLAMVETRQEVVLSARQYLLALAEEAVDVVGKKLTEEQNTQVALSLLRGIGVLAPQSTEARLREDVQAAKDFCAKSATLDETCSTDPNVENKFRAQTATLGETDDPNTNNKFRAQTATLGETKAATLPTEEDEFPPSLQGLPLPQQLAIEALFEGKTVAEVAALAQASEARVRSWLCGDEPFYEALTALQFDRIYHLKYRLLTLLQQAMQIIQTAINEGNGRVALALLQGFGVTR